MPEEDNTATTPVTGKRGRPPCPESAEFHDITGQEPEKQKLSLCKHCDRAHRDDPEAVTAPAPIARRRENLQRHIAKCPHIPEDLRSQYSMPTPEPRLNGTPLSRPRYSLGSNSVEPVSQSPSGTSEDWDEQQMSDFYRLLINFQRDNDLPDSFVTRTSTLQFFELMSPGTATVLPSADELAHMRQATIAADTAIASVSAIKHRRTV
ncbi:hypothetical protein ATCC90586_001897 [Pythium insidiosum]|nr:hypothetical protein ATCC90586_001897 [Pythium insidiosum]